MIMIIFFAAWAEVGLTVPDEETSSQRYKNMLHIYLIYATYFTNAKL